MSCLSLLRGSRRRRPYLYRKRAIHRSRPTYSCSLEEAQGSIREGRPPPPFNPSKLFHVQGREEKKDDHVSLGAEDQPAAETPADVQPRGPVQPPQRGRRTGLRASAQAQPGHPLSLHRKAMQNTPSGSLKRPEDPSASPAQNPATSVDKPLGADLSGDIPETPITVPGGPGPPK